MRLDLNIGFKHFQRACSKFDMLGSLNTSTYGSNLKLIADMDSLQLHIAIWSSMMLPYIERTNEKIDECTLLFWSRLPSKWSFLSLTSDDLNLNQWSLVMSAKFLNNFCPWQVAMLSGWNWRQNQRVKL